MAFEKKLKKAFLINAEIQLRCGDGTGMPPTSHSTNCNCRVLLKDLEKLSDIEVPGKYKPK